MAIAYAAAALLAGSCSLALLWRQAPWTAIFITPFVASASVLALGGAVALLNPLRDRERDEARLSPE